MATFRAQDTDQWPELGRVANNIEKFRIQAGWSQRELAELMATKQSYIFAVEGCGTDMSLTKLLQFARVFERPVNDFFLEKPPERKRLGGK